MITALDICGVGLVSSYSFNPSINSCFIDRLLRKMLKDCLIQDLTNTAEILTCLFDLFHYMGHKLQVCFIIRRKVINKNIARLSVTIDATIALFQSHWIPRDLLMKNKS